MVFPDALILHTIRDPLDTLFSCFRCKFDDAGLEWSLDTGDLVLQYAKYLEIMQHFRKVLPGRVIDVRYVIFMLPAELKASEHGCITFSLCLSVVNCAHLCNILI